MCVEDCVTTGVGLVLRKLVETAALLEGERGGADGRMLNSMRSAPPPPPSISESWGYMLDVSRDQVAGRTLSVSGSI